jgi:hypothetical protein
VTGAKIYHNQSNVIIFRPKQIADLDRRITRGSKRRKRRKINEQEKSRVNSSARINKSIKFC